MERRNFISSLFWLASGAALMPINAIGKQAAYNQINPIRRNVGTFTGRGGTIGWLADENAMVVIDSQFPPSAGAFFEKVQQYSSQPIDALINTHHHTDHTAGNSFFRNLASEIVAHENVPELQRSVAEMQNTLDDQVYADTTFEDSWSLDTGDEIIHAMHYGPAHTSGDIVIRFEKANVIHMGDLIFNRWYPFIDMASGASISNWIHFLERVIQDSEPDTVFIFGHGSNDFGIRGSVRDILIMRNYLSALLEFVENKQSEGSTLGEIRDQQELPGFPDHVSAGSRLSLRANIEAAWQELSNS
jgi:cyclase